MRSQSQFICPVSKTWLEALPSMSQFHHAESKPFCMLISKTQFAALPSMSQFNLAESKSICTPTCKANSCMHIHDPICCTAQYETNHTCSWSRLVQAYKTNLHVHIQIRFVALPSMRLIVHAHEVNLCMRTDPISTRPIICIFFWVNRPKIDELKDFLDICYNSCLCRQQNPSAGVCRAKHRTPHPECQMK